jgi:hypothetical protein
MEANYPDTPGIKSVIEDQLTAEYTCSQCGGKTKTTKATSETTKKRHQSCSGRFDVAAIAQKRLHEIENEPVMPIWATCLGNLILLIIAILICYFFLWR